jgi:O-antigen/teichoic acid export membrane protein
VLTCEGIGADESRVAYSLAPERPTRNLPPGRAIKDMFPRRFLPNLMSNYAGAVVSILLALVLTPVLVRGLGQDAYGVWGLTSTLVSYLGLLQFGTGGAAIRQIAQDEERGDRDHMRAVVTTLAWTLMVPGALVLLASPALALTFPLAFHVSDALRGPAMVCVGLTVVEFAFAIFTNVCGVVLIGLQRYDLLNLTVAGTSLAQAAAWVAIVLLGGGLVPLSIALVVLGFVGQSARYWFARQTAGFNPFARRFAQRNLVRPLITSSVWMAVTDVTEAVTSELDAIIVGIIVSVRAAAVYLVAQKLASLVSSAVMPVQAMYYSHAATLDAGNARDTLREAMSSGIRVALAVAVPLMLVLDALAHPALDAWVGHGYSSGVVVIICLSSAFVLDAFSRTPVYVLRGMGDLRRPAQFAVAGVALNLVLSVVLALTMGLQGVAVATLVSGGVMNFGFTLPYACRRLGVPLAGLVLSALRSQLPASAAALGVGFLLRGAGVKGLGEVTGAGAAMFTAYVAVLLISGLSSRERTLIIGAVQRRLAGRAS